MNKETYRKLMDKIQFSDDLTQNVMEKIDSLQDQRISLSSLQKRITALTAVLGIAAAAAFGIYNFSGNISENQMHTSGYSSTVESVSAKADGTVKDISIEPQEIMVFDYDNANQENISTILAAVKGKTQSYDIGYVNNGTYTCLKHQISDSLIHLSASTENRRNFKWYVKKSVIGNHNCFRPDNPIAPMILFTEILTMTQIRSGYQKDSRYPLLISVPAPTMYPYSIFTCIIWKQWNRQNLGSSLILFFMK